MVISLAEEMLLVCVCRPQTLPLPPSTSKCLSCYSWSWLNTAERIRGYMQNTCVCTYFMLKHPWISLAEKTGCLENNISLLFQTTQIRPDFRWFCRGWPITNLVADPERQLGVFFRVVWHAERLVVQHLGRAATPDDIWTCVWSWNKTCWDWTGSSDTMTIVKDGPVCDHWFQFQI